MDKIKKEIKQIKHNRIPKYEKYIIDIFERLKIISNENCTLFEYSETMNTLRINYGQLKTSFPNFDTCLIKLIENYIDKPNIKTIIK